MCRGFPGKTAAGVGGYGTRRVPTTLPITPATELRKYAAEIVNERPNCHACLLNERDPAGEVKGWLQAIAGMVAEA